MNSERFVKRRFFVLFLSLCFMFSLVASQYVQSTVIEPIDRVRETVEKVLSIVTDESLAGTDKADEKNRRIFEVVEKCFDFREMSQRALATHWKKLSSDQQDNFTRLFSRLLQNTYLKKINMYSDEEIQYKGQDIRKNRAVVETVVLKNNVEIPLVYRLKRKTDQWRVYDVVIEGVSLVRNYRSQFRSILNKEKYPGLIKRMEKKIEKSGEAQ